MLSYFSLVLHQYHNTNFNKINNLISETNWKILLLQDPNRTTDSFVNELENSIGAIQQKRSYKRTKKKVKIYEKMLNKIVRDVIRENTV